MPKSSKNGMYAFDRFKLDAEKLMLYRDEIEISLPPKVVQTLAVLIQYRGTILSKDELIDRVWSDSIVEESNLSQNLYMLRKTLGTKPDGSPYIETLRRRGYRFTGDVQIVERTFEQTNGTATRSARPSIGVEREGNVLRLVEWSPAQHSNEAVQTLAPAIAAKRKPFWLAISLTVILGIAAIGAGYFLYNSNAAATTQHQPEVKILRLTNGIEPGGASISPDGKYFAYAEQSGPVNRLWLQQTGYSSRVEIIPPSESLITSTGFSPDAQFVYYLKWDPSAEVNSLFRVPTLGGPTKKVFDHVGSFSFSPDGREMVYGRYDKQKNEVQYVIRASDGSGGERVIHSAAGSYSGWPAWSPDGKTIVFGNELPGNRDVGSIVLTAFDIETGSLRPVSDEKWDISYRMMWRPDGRGFYFLGTRSGESMTPSRDQLYYVSYPDGRSIRITTDAASRHQPGSLGVTNDGSVLVVPFNRASQIWAMDANGDSRSARQITSGLNDGRAGLAPLADGRLAYITRQGDNLNIWKMNQDGSDQKPLLVEPPITVELSSSRSGPYLMFASLTDPAHFHVFRVDLDGNDSKQMTFGDGREEDPAISNDGNWVAYTQRISRGKVLDLSLWKMPIEGGEPVQISKQRCELPHFSPDDKLISCTEDFKTIHILSADDGTLVRTLSFDPILADGSTARWTPDGRSVAYVVTEKGVSNIWLHPIDGGEPKRLTDFSTASIYNFAFSLDGTRLFLARGQQIRDAILIQNIR